MVSKEEFERQRARAGREFSEQRQRLDRVVAAHARDFLDQVGRNAQIVAMRRDAADQRVAAAGDDAERREQ